MAKKKARVRTVLQMKVFINSSNMEFEDEVNSWLGGLPIQSVARYQWLKSDVGKWFDLIIWYKKSQK